MQSVRSEPPGRTTKQQRPSFPLKGPNLPRLLARSRARSARWARTNGGHAWRAPPDACNQSAGVIEPGTASPPPINDQRISPKPKDYLLAFLRSTKNKQIVAKHERATRQASPGLVLRWPLKASREGGGLVQLTLLSRSRFRSRSASSGRRANQAYCSLNFSSGRAGVPQTV